MSGGSKALIAWAEIGFGVAKLATWARACTPASVRPDAVTWIFSPVSFFNTSCSTS